MLLGRPWGGSRPSPSTTTRARSLHRDWVHERPPGWRAALSVRGSHNARSATVEGAPARPGGGLGAGFQRRGERTRVCEACGVLNGARSGSYAHCTACAPSSGRMARTCECGGIGGGRVREAVVRSRPPGAQSGWPGNGGRRWQGRAGGPARSGGAGRLGSPTALNRLSSSSRLNFSSKMNSRRLQPKRKKYIINIHICYKCLLRLTP